MEISEEVVPTIDDVLQTIEFGVGTPSVDEYWFGELPNEADEPTVNEVNISTFPILLISILTEA